MEKMYSRIREKPDHLFNLFVEVVKPETEEGWLVMKYPETYEDESVLKAIPMFCFPTGTAVAAPVQHFCFVLTDMEGKFSFGFCRLGTDGKDCLCIISSLPWHDLFYKLLNYICDLIMKNPDADLTGLLRTAYQISVPRAGEELHIIYKLQKVEFQSWCPDTRKLPSIPENRAITEYFNALDTNSMVTVFASLLNERRIIITSKKLGRLTACVMACDAVLYPMHCPVEPFRILMVYGFSSLMKPAFVAPMPYIIGVPSDLMPQVLSMDLGEVVIVDADEHRVSTPHTDVQELPSSVISSIKSSSGKMFGDGVARAFMRALVELIGGYRFGLSFPAGEKITFEKEKFIRSRPVQLQPFLTHLVDHQCFRQFIDERLDMLNSGEGFSDEFEQEVSLLIDQESDSSDRTSVGAQYRRWSTKGGSLLKSGIRQMKDRSKEAVKGLRSKMQEARDSALGPEVLQLPEPGPLNAPGSPSQTRLYSTNPVFGSQKGASFYQEALNRISTVSIDDGIKSDRSTPNHSVESEPRPPPLPPKMQKDVSESGAVSEDSLIDFQDEPDKKAKELLDLVNLIQNPVADSVLPSNPTYTLPQQLPPWRPHSASPTPRPTWRPAWHGPVALGRSTFYGSLPSGNSSLPANWNSPARFGLSAPKSTLPPNWGLAPRPLVPSSASAQLNSNGLGGSDGSLLVREASRPKPTNDSGRWENFE